MNSNPFPEVLVTGGAGYVGARLVPRLLAEGYRVRVLDLYLYEAQPFGEAAGHANLREIRGDLRDRQLLSDAVAGCDAVIHLACISNDPSFELDPTLGKSINYDAFFHLVDVSRAAGVRRFIYASSSSVYGIKPGQDVTEELPLEPLTDYSRYKALCEDVLLARRGRGFETLIVRPATVCGWSPRLRLDLTVNILTNHAVNNRSIKVFGGEQMRPNIHILDMVELYARSLRWPAEKIDGKVFNAGYDNLKVRDIAETVRRVVGDDVRIVTTPTDDHRSYHISSEKIRRELGFVPRYTVEDAVRELAAAFEAGKIPNSMTDPRYYNIKVLQAKKLPPAPERRSGLPAGKAAIRETNPATPHFVDYRDYDAVRTGGSDR
jgi:nucleoside-diphosphate-sugar epimerase